MQRIKIAHSNGSRGAAQQCQEGLSCLFCQQQALHVIATGRAAIPERKLDGKEWSIIGCSYVRDLFITGNFSVIFQHKTADLKLAINDTKYKIVYNVKCSICEDEFADVRSTFHENPSSASRI